MKKNVNYVERAKFEELIAASGLPTSDKKGWTRVDGQAGRRLYVPKTKRVGRIDCAGLSGEGLRLLPEDEAHGAVTHGVDFSLTEEQVLAAFSAALDGLASLEAVAKPAKEPKAPRERKAKGTGETPTAEPTTAEGRESRIALIRQVAAEKGVAVTAELEDGNIETLGDEATDIQ